MLPLLCAAAAAVLAGACSLIAIGEWITDAPQSVLRDLDFPADPLTRLRAAPHPATVRRLLQRLDGDTLDAAIGAYLQARTPPLQPPEPPTKPALRAIAVDGKTVRGSRTPTATAIQLLAAMDHHGVVLAQRQITSKSNEIPAFQPLLDTIDLTGTVLSGDALHTQHGHGAYLRERGAHYLAIVKKNHPGLYAQVTQLPWAEIPLDHRTRDRAHHRDEIRRLKVAAFRRIDYPSARQAIQITRPRRLVFLALSVAVLFEGAQTRRRQGGASFGALGLGREGDQAAGVRALEGASDAGGFADQVELFPAQAEEFALAESGVKSKKDYMPVAVSGES